MIARSDFSVIWFNQKTDHKNGLSTICFKNLKLSKYTIILIILGVIVATTGTLFFLMWTGLIFPLTSTITGSYCVWVGAVKLADRELALIQNNTENPTLFLDLTNDDLKQVPKLKEAIDKVDPLVQYNDMGRTTITPAEARDYQQFFAKKFEEQYNSKLKNEQFVFVYYNGKTYVIDGLILTDTPNDIELSAALYTAKVSESITIMDADFDSIPKVKKVIDEIGTYEVSPHASVGLPEDEQNMIQKWFERKYKEQYGVDGSTSYFHYNGKSYSASFAIC